MSFEELTGSPPDPDCLHCYLAPLIDRWVQAHPHVASSDVLGQLAQVLGELIASGSWNAGRPQHADANAAIAASITRQTVRDMLRALNRRTTKQ